MLSIHHKNANKQSMRIWHMPVYINVHVQCKTSNIERNCSSENLHFTKSLVSSYLSQYFLGESWKLAYTHKNVCALGKNWWFVVDESETHTVRYQIWRLLFFRLLFRHVNLIFHIHFWKETNILKWKQRAT